MFLNSLKMKMAIVLGIAHMMFGIMMNLLNHLHFRDNLGVIFEFIPRFLFLFCTFGYMVVIIIVKWCTDWSDPAVMSAIGNTTGPPNLIQTMIFMFLSPGNIDAPLFNGQAGLQAFFLLIAFFCVPLMLCPKPMLEHAKAHGEYRDGIWGTWFHSPVDDEPVHGDSAHDDGHAQPDAHLNYVAEDENKDEEGDHANASASGSEALVEQHEEHTLGDRLIHQGIHTIEFVLGAVSNTASYLRLWALSLAHAQLAEVFWSKFIAQYGYENGAIFAVIGFGGWLCATVGVLMIMDVLECFLHALRLHWVEFQNKFYAADGLAYRPFRF
jgi:V-type H+-transporting ATPase subunit a